MRTNINEIDFEPYRGSLAHKAFRFDDSKGNRYPLSGCGAFYSCAIDRFYCDTKNILSSELFGRLNYKTQVFSDYQTIAGTRNRMRHTLEVFNIGETIAHVLGLNVNLIKAISLAHDVGYCALGRGGVLALSEIAEEKFCHEVTGVAFLQAFEKLNLSWEVLEGVLLHSRGAGSLEVNPEFPLEYGVIPFADKIAILSDFDDGLVRGFFAENQLPKELFALGRSLEER